MRGRHRVEEAAELRARLHGGSCERRLEESREAATATLARREEVRRWPKGVGHLGGWRRGLSIGELLSLAKRGGDRKMEGIEGEKSEGDGALGPAFGGARGG